MPAHYKGERDQMTTRPPLEVGNIVRARAFRAGIPYGDFVAAILSEYVGLSHLCPMPDMDHTNPLALPLEEFQLPRTA